MTEGERLILDENMTLDTLLPAHPAGTLRRLSEEEMRDFKRPYPSPESRRLLVAWTRSIPVAGDPADVAERMARNWTFLCKRDIPKLAMIAKPAAD